MGLDMYLSARRYIGGTFEQAEYNKVFAAISKGCSSEIPDSSRLPSVTVEVSLMYWRKANAIHNWFVTNCADGVDDCQSIEVDRNHLEELRDLCTKILELRDRHGFVDGELVSEEFEDKCIELLTPTPGFFFGSYQIDGWYFQDIEYTQRELARIIDWVVKERENNRFWYIMYRASW